MTTLTNKQRRILLKTLGTAAVAVPIVGLMGCEVEEEIIEDGLVDGITPDDDSTDEDTSGDNTTDNSTDDDTTTEDDLASGEWAVGGTELIT